ncbi:MAG: cyclic nucleotide-binding domain-containing protein [Lachnospiraceae bacterium]|nr:cyclic nucleotide-binding domain-containing protein [Lachnospiraceae bacterium]
MADSKIVQFPEGAIILREGDDNSCIYKIIKGFAEVYVGYGTEQESLIGIIGKQACFGEFGLLLHEPAVYTVIAYSELYALKIGENDISEFIMDNHNNVLDIMRNMANTMMVMRTEIKMLIEEIESGKKPDKETVDNARKAMRACGMYRSIQEAAAAIKDQGQ